jgi:hypothetical protein
LRYFIKVAGTELMRYLEVLLNTMNRLEETFTALLEQAGGSIV